MTGWAAVRRAAELGGAALDAALEAVSGAGCAQLAGRGEMTWDAGLGRVPLAGGAQLRVRVGGPGRPTQLEVADASGAVRYAAEVGGVV